MKIITKNNKNGINTRMRECKTVLTDIKKSIILQQNQHK